MVGPRFLLIGESLVDVRNKAHVWSYPSLAALPGSLNNQVWYLGNKEVPMLINRRLPSDKTLALIDKVVESRRPKNVGTSHSNSSWAGYQGIGSSVLTTGGEKQTIHSEFQSFVESK